MLERRGKKYFAPTVQPFRYSIIQLFKTNNPRH
jgi:hypothetical protein